MFYSNFEENVPVYVRDEQGEIVYQTMPDGTSVPKKTGLFENRYSEPVEFFKHAAERRPDSCPKEAGRL